jgi:cobalt-zinc-cadmium efflux system protein
MSHAHRHAGNDRGAGRRSLTLALTITLTFLAIEAVGALITGSLALLSDAGHMLSDSSALALSLLAIWLAARPHTHRRTFGYHRAEIVSALANGVLLVILAGVIVFEAIGRLSDPPEIDSAPMLVIAAAGLAANIAAGGILAGSRHDSLNVRSAFWHVAGDALGSIGAIAAALVMLATGWYLADPLISIAIAALVMLSGLRVAREAMSIVLESAPRHLDMQAIREDLLGLPGVSDVHDLHAWTITSGFVALSAHARVLPDGDAAAVVRGAGVLLAERYGIQHATIQPETEPLHSDAEPGACCLGEHAATPAS